MAFISSKKWNSLRNQMLNLDISESDIQESFVLSSGSGGQKVNKTYSCVQLNYKGHKVRCSKTRSRDANRYFARLALCEDIAKHQGILTKSFLKLEKKIKQKKRRKRKSASKYSDELP